MVIPTFERWWRSANGGVASDKNPPHDFQRFALHGLLVLFGILTLAAIRSLAVPDDRQAAIEAIRQSGGFVGILGDDHCQPRSPFSFAPAASGPIETVEVFNAKVAKAAILRTGIHSDQDELRILA